MRKKLISLLSRTEFIFLGILMIITSIGLVNGQEILNQFSINNSPYSSYTKNYTLQGKVVDESGNLLTNGIVNVKIIDQEPNNTVWDSSNNTFSTYTNYNQVWYDISAKINTNYQNSYVIRGYSYCKNRTDCHTESNIVNKSSVSGLTFASTDSYIDLYWHVSKTLSEPVTPQSTYTLYGRTTVKNGASWDDLNGISVEIAVLDFNKSEPLTRQYYTSGPVGGSFTFKDLPLPKNIDSNYTHVLVNTNRTDIKYLGYTVCYNTTTCHNDTPIYSAGYVYHKYIQDKGFADIWLHFEKANQVTVNLSANPNPAEYNGSTSLNWSSTGAKYCWGYDGGSTGWYGEKSTSGSQLISGLTKDTTFKLVCRYETGVENEMSVLVKVKPNPAIYCDYNNYPQDMYYFCVYPKTDYLKYDANKYDREVEAGKYQTNDPIDFNWGSGVVGSSGEKDKVVMVIRTKRYFDGDYIFHVSSDDGVILEVDGKKVLDKWVVRSTTEDQVKVNNLTGNKNITLRYFENTGSAQLKFWWEKTYENIITPPVAETNVIGTLQEVKCDNSRDIGYQTATANGNANDPDSPAGQVEIRFYRGGDNKSGVYLGQTYARSSQTSTVKTFSFNFEVSDYKNSSLYAYAVDIQTGIEKYIGMFNYNCSSQTIIPESAYIIKGEIVDSKGNNIGSGKVLVYVNDSNNKNLTNSSNNPFNFSFENPGAYNIGIDVDIPISGLYDLIGYTKCDNSISCHNSQNISSGSNFNYNFAGQGYVDIRWYLKEKTTEPEEQNLKIDLKVYDNTNKLVSGPVAVSYNSDATISWNIENLKITDRCKIVNNIDSNTHIVDKSTGEMTFRNLTKNITYSLECNNNITDSVNIVVQEKQSEQPQEEDFENVSGGPITARCDNSKWLNSVFTRFIGIFTNQVEISGQIDDNNRNLKYKIGVYLDGDKYIGSTYSDNGSFSFSFNPLLKNIVPWNGLPTLTGDVYVYIIDQYGERKIYLDKVNYDCDLHIWPIPEKEEKQVKNVDLDFGVKQAGSDKKPDSSISFAQGGMKPELVWETTNAIVCVAGGDWGNRNRYDSGKKVSGSEILYGLEEGKYEYILTCRGEDEKNKVEKRVLITVESGDNQDVELPQDLENYAYKVIEKSPGASLKPGEKSIFWVTLENTGKNPWYNDGENGEALLINYPVGEDSLLYTKYGNNGLANWISKSEIRRGDSPLAEYSDKMSFGFYITAPQNQADNIITQCASLKIMDRYGNSHVAIDQERGNVFPICWDLEIK